MELSQNSYEPETFWQIVWDAVRGILVRVAYVIIDGITMMLKQLVYYAAYGQAR